MVLLPIVERELRVAARRKATYGGRMSAALAATVFGAYLILTIGFADQRQIGQILFNVGVTILSLYAIFAGAAATADSISMEKRENTLGLLFLTDLKPYDVVLGKLAAYSLQTIYGMLAVLPVLAIPFLTGGVKLDEFARVILVSFNNLFFSIAAGLLASVLCREERAGMAVAFGIILVITGGIPGLGALIAESRNEPMSKLFQLPSPGFGAIMATDGPYRSLGNPALFYLSLACVLLTSLLLLALACWCIPRMWKDRAGSARWERMRRFHNWVVYGTPEYRVELRRKQLDLNPVLWLSLRDRTKPLVIWGTLLCVALGWGYVVAKNQSDWPEMAFGIAITTHMVLKVILATESCKMFITDRKSGVLELVLSTPLKVREILQGQWHALWRRFALPVTMVLVADVVFASCSRDQSHTISFWLVLMFNLVADMVAISWVGMWMGLRMTNINRAAGAVMLRIMVVPALCFGLFMTMAVKGGGTNITPEGVFFFWLFICLGCDLVFGVIASTNLQEKFRSMVHSRFQEPKRSILAQWFGRGTES